MSIQQSFQTKQNNMLEYTSIERLQEIEAERQQTETDPNFQAWMIELNVSSLYQKKDGINNAKDMMKDYSPLTKQLWE